MGPVNAGSRFVTSTRDTDAVFWETEHMNTAKWRHRREAAYRLLLAHLELECLAH